MIFSLMKNIPNSLKVEFPKDYLPQRSFSSKIMVIREPLKFNLKKTLKLRVLN